MLDCDKKKYRLYPKNLELLLDPTVKLIVHHEFSEDSKMLSCCAQPLCFTCLSENKVTTNLTDLDSHAISPLQTKQKGGGCNLKLWTLPCPRPKGNVLCESVLW